MRPHSPAAAESSASEPAAGSLRRNENEPPVDFSLIDPQRMFADSAAAQPVPAFKGPFYPLDRAWEAVPTPLS